jgi:hypothetical protein
VSIRTAGKTRRGTFGSGEYGEVKLEEITSEMLGRAIEIYLRLAYAGGEPSAVVRGRAAIPAERRGRELVEEERFERVPAGAALGEAERYNLRLGNAGYLNMKLGICRVAATEDYVLRVDTHDKMFAAMVQEKENAEYAALIERNRKLQNEIERAWSEAGLPTFENYLREQLEKVKGKK